MANFTVNTASSSYQGTVDADVFLINTGLGITVNGSAGNDTITAGAATTYQSGLIGGDAGNDLFNLNARTATYTAFEVLGAAGSDTITLSDARAVSLRVAGGADVDYISLNSGTFNLSTIGGGAADDTLTAAFSTFQGSRLQAGAGADTFVVNSGINAYLSSTIELGGGDDTLTFSGVIANSTIGGSDGLDVITVAAAGLQANGLNFIGGGAGADQISINGTVATNIAANFGSVQGGGGSDILRVSGVAATTGGIVFGGAGADNITLAGIASGATVVAPAAVNAASGMIVAYSAFSDSTLGSNQGVGTMDTVSASVASGATTTGGGRGAYMLQQSAVTFQSFVSGNYADGAVWNGSGQYLFGTNSGALATLQSRVQVVDSQLTTAGMAATFNDTAGNSYVFVQGGTAGTSDDLLVAVNGASGALGVNKYSLGFATNNSMKVIFSD